LDEHDSDLTTFLNYFVAAIQTMFPQACQGSAGLLRAASLPPVPVITGTLMNELADIDQPYVLVLDDYHTIRDQSVRELLTELLRHPPEGMRLVLSTRRDPLLPLARMRAQGLVTEIRTEDLRFTTDEAAALLRQWIEAPVDEATISVLEETTEGWVTGLRLMVLSVRHRGDLDNLVTGLHGSSRYVTQYLMSEVLSRQPPELQDFLVRSSILGRFCAPLCDALRFVSAESQGNPSAATLDLGPGEPPQRFKRPFVVALDEIGQSGQAYLERLAEENLFLVSLDDEGQWFRYHHLFQQFLLSRLKQQLPSGEIAALHVQAAGWFARNGLVEEALYHSLAADDTSGAVRLVAQHRHRLMNRDQWQRLARWLRLFPHQVTEAEPELLVLDAWLKQVRWQTKEMLAVLERAETHLVEPYSSGGADAASHLQAEIDALRTASLLFSADMESGLAHGRRTLTNLPRGHYYVRGYATMLMGCAYQMAGDLDAAVALATGGLLEMPRNEMFHTRLLGMLCMVYWMDADLENLWLSASRCFEISQEVDAVLSLTASHHFQGCVHYHRNDLIAAEQVFRDVIDRRYATHALTYAYCVVGLASTYQAQGWPDRAREVVDSAIAFMLETHSPVMLPVAQAFQAELAARQGRLAEASRWASQAGSSQLQQSLPGFYGPQLALPKVLLALDTAASRRQAADLLPQLRRFVQTIHNTRFLIEVLALQALLHQAQGEQSAALDALQQAITLAQPGGFVRLFVDLGPKLEPLLAQLWQQGVAPAYIAQILGAFPGFVPKDGDRPMPGTRQPTHTELVETLTNREMDVLLLLAERKINKEIAGELGISTETVKRHTRNLYRKLDVRNRRQAAARARTLGILPAD
jgi:LuxR family maltose regulon positive regulatory protein